MKLTFKKAKSESLLKWKYAKETGCSPSQLEKFLRKKYPRMFQYEGQCGLCAYNWHIYDGDCDMCFLSKAGQYCDAGGSLFKQWAFGRHKKAKRKELATEMYNTIKNLNTKTKRK